MKTLFTLFSILFFFNSAQAADPGYFVRSDCGVLSPVTNGTVCLQSTTVSGRTAGKLYIYDGAWTEHAGGSGDLTAVQATTPITVANGTGPIPTVACPTCGVKGDTLFNASDYNFSTTDPAAVTTVGVANPIYHMPVLSKVTAGALVSNTYTARITLTNAAGETLPSLIAVLTVEANKQLKVTSPVVGSEMVLNATGWNVYIAYSGVGSETKQNVTPIAIGTDWTSTGYVAGAALPTANTTGSTTVTPAAFSNSSGMTSFYAPMITLGSGTQKETHFQPLLIDEGGANEEVVLVESVSGSTFTAIFTKTHSAGYTVKSATQGIAEAVFAIGPVGGQNPDGGGTILLPQGVVTIKAPIPLRNYTEYLGRGGERWLGATSATTGYSQITFNSTDTSKAAFFAQSIIGTDGTAGVVLKNFAIFSQTHGVLTGGIMGGLAGFTLQGMRITANRNQVVGRRASALRASYGTTYLVVRDSRLEGSPGIEISGTITIGTWFISSWIDLQTGVNTGDGKGIVMTANSGGLGTGASAGGALFVYDTVFEAGIGSILDLTDVHTLILQNTGNSDWTGSAGVPVLAVTTTSGENSSALVFRDSFFYNNATSATAAIKFTQGAGSNIKRVVFENVAFTDSGHPAIDAGTATGPFIISGANQITLATSGSGSIQNQPTNGIVYCGNVKVGGSTLDDRCNLAPNLLTDSGLLQQYSGATAQAHEIYGTRTDASNYKRTVLKHDGTNATLTVQGAGTGGGGGALNINTNGDNINFAGGTFTFDNHQVNMDNLTASRPVATDANKYLVSGTYSGNTTAVVTTTGAQTSGAAVLIDANGNHIAGAGASGNVLRGNGTNFVSAQLGFSDLSGTASDAQIPDTITASNYLPLSGGTLTGQLVTDNLGIEFTEDDVNPTCAAGNFNIFADLSENKLKKCQNGSVSDLDTTGGTPSFDTITGGTNTTAAMVVGTGGSLGVSGSGTIVATSGDSATSFFSSGILEATIGGTGNGFTAFTGPTTSTKTFTLPDASSTLLYSGGALGTPSSGTLTNATGLPQAGTVGLTTADSPQFTALNVGHASDTTITRVSAGVIAVEGATVSTVSVKPITIDAGAFTADGTNCADPTERTIASGHKTWTIRCADSDSSVFYWKVRMPATWNAGTVTITLTAVHGTTETITLAGDHATACRRDGDTWNNTYGTPVQGDVSITTANVQVSTTSGAVTANGTCAASAYLIGKFTIDATTNSANAANTDILSLTLNATY